MKLEKQRALLAAEEGSTTSDPAEELSYSGERHRLHRLLSKVAATAAARPTILHLSRSGLRPPRWTMSKILLDAPDAFPDAPKDAQ